MNQTHSEMLDDVAVYALGSLPPADAARVREHLAGCDECRREYEALTATVGAIARSVEACVDLAHGAVVASPLLKARIMREVRRDAVRARVWPAYAVAAACFALALASSLYSLAMTDRLRHAQEQLAHETTVTQQELAVVTDLSNPTAKRTLVPGGEIVRSNGHLYIAMQDMPKAPSGKVYQAWTLPKGSKTMVPSVTFKPDRHGVAVVTLAAKPDTTAAVAVSIEPAGGSRQPTSAPVVLAHLE